MRCFISTLYVCVGLMMSAAGCAPGQLVEGGGGVTLVDSSTGRDALGGFDGGSPTDSGGSGELPDARADTSATIDSGPPATDAGPPPVDAASGVDADDMALFTLVNDYRVSRGLPALPLSPSLSLVARTHVEDLIAHGANSGACNLHSWSDEGSWSGCCYTSDHSQASCMWNKPRELTDYPGNGYEISTGGARDGAHALSLWQSSGGHHDVIINGGAWSQPWGAMGVAITPGAFAHIWFGREADPAL
ncbi:MAG: CAP domain-containing protein [Polyangiales bacterium]